MAMTEIRRPCRQPRNVPVAILAQDIDKLGQPRPLGGRRLSPGVTQPERFALPVRLVGQACYEMPRRLDGRGSGREEGCKNCAALLWAERAEPRVALVHEARLPLESLLATRGQRRAVSVALQQSVGSGTQRRGQPGDSV